MGYTGVAFESGLVGRSGHSTHGRKDTPDVGRAEQRPEGKASVAQSLDWAPERQAFGGGQCSGSDSALASPGALLFHRSFLAVVRQGWATPSPLRNGVRPGTVV